MARGLPSGWELVAVSRFQRRQQTRLFALQNAGTRPKTAILVPKQQYVFWVAFFAPTLPANWRVVGVCGLQSRRARADYLLYNASTRPNGDLVLVRPYFN